MKLEATLRAKRDAGQKLLVPYVTGGLGAAWLDVVRAVALAGADAIEIGIPFSDPVMDGRTIQEASQRALDIGATPAGIAADLAKLDVDVPLVVMTYYNPVQHMGHERFAAALVAGGVDAAIVPDLPLDELDGWGDAADAAGIETVLLAGPTTGDERLVADLRAHPRLRLRRRADGRDRRARAPGRPGQGDGAAVQGGDRQAGAARARASRTRRRPRRRRTRPTA